MLPNNTSFNAFQEQFMNKIMLGISLVIHGNIVANFMQTFSVSSDFDIQVALNF